MSLCCVKKKNTFWMTKESVIYAFHCPPSQKTCPELALDIWIPLAYGRTPLNETYGHCFQDGTHTHTASNYIFFGQRGSIFHTSE